MDQVHQCDTATVMILIRGGEVGIICSDEQFNVTHQPSQCEIYLAAAD